MLAAVKSAVLEGVEGRVVTVEVHVSRGLPGYTVVGLPDAAGRQHSQRVLGVGPDTLIRMTPVDQDHVHHAGIRPDIE